MRYKDTSRQKEAETNHTAPINRNMKVWPLREACADSVQTLIRWCLQHNAVAIPKSSMKERILENSKVFDFEVKPEEMRQLDSLSEDMRTNWDPTIVP